MDGKKRKKKDSTSDTESSDDSDRIEQYPEKTSHIKIQRPSSNKIMKNKAVVISNVLLSKNLVKTADSNGKCVGLQPIDKSSNVQIPMDSYNVLLNYLQSIVTGIEKIKNEQLSTRNEIRNLSSTFDRYITRDNSIDNPIHWMEQHEIELPLRSVEKYEQLCSLMKDKNIKNQCIIIIDNAIDANTTLSRNVLAVIRKFFHRDLAMKYTCIKKIENKETLKPSKFYDCIKDLFLAKSRSGKIRESNLCEKAFDKILSPILTNSKDWNKGRFLGEDTKENDDTSIENTDNETDNLDNEG